MGGATVGCNGNTLEEVLAKIKQQIINAHPGVQPDSDVAVLDKKQNVGRIFKVHIDGFNEITGIRFEEVEKGHVGLPVTIDGIYGEKTEDRYRAVLHFG